MKQKINGFDMILLALSVVLLLGVLTVLAPCGAKEDGSRMTCHWAGNAVAGAAAVLTALSVMELKAEGVSRRYFRKSKLSNVFLAVKETSLTLRAGQFTEITGRSGSGKSTLLHMLAGLLAPTTGRVLLGGADFYALDDAERSMLRNKSVGVIPQGQTALRSLTVMENVKLPCTMYGDAVSDDAALELLERVGLAALRGAWPNELSGGELRRLAIARALLRKPAVLLADEPTSNLDDENTHAVLRLLRQCADEGAAMLLVAHEREAAEYADRVLRMSDGVLAAE